ncbi:MAG: iron-containing alcohol dehydrogenase [Bacteroidales bacterium]
MPGKNDAGQPVRGSGFLKRQSGSRPLSGAQSGGYLDLAHGECNALLLPHVVDFNFHHAADKYRHIAGEMGVHVAGLSDREARKMLTFHLLEMNRKLGITGSLKERGVQSDLLPLLAGKAIQDPCNATNPRPPVRADLEAVYAESM